MSSRIKEYLASGLFLILFAIPALAGFPSLPYSHVNGQIANADHVNANNLTLLNGFTTGTYTGDFSDLKIGGIAVISAARVGTFTDLTSPAIPPIGSIIPFYDYNGALTFNSSYWAYCDGSTATITGIGVQTLPDLSNRYLVGFGTDGGGNIDTATWETAVVGNASHQINLQHAHSTDIASFTSGAGSAHGHGVGTLQFQVGEISNDGTTLTVGFYTNAGSIVPNYHINLTGQPQYASGTYGTVFGFGNTSGTGYTASGTGSTATESSHTHAIDPGATSSDNQLSTAQSIQPRSIRVRFLLRIK